MKLMATVLLAGLLGFGCALTHAQQPVDGRSGEVFQVKKNILITDITGARFSDQHIEDLRLSEDGSDQKIADLSSNAGTLNLVIVIDDSGSMSSQRAHVAAVGKFIVQNLEPGARVQLVRFPGPKGGRVVNQWTSDKTLLFKLFDEAQRGGGDSPVYDGVWTALDQIKDARMQPDEKRFAIVLISDCIEGGSLRSRDELLDELNRSSVPLFTVTLSEQFDRVLKSSPNPQIEAWTKRFERFAHDSALASGGSAYFPRKGANAKLPLAETLKDLTAEVWSQFVLTYTPTNQNRDGKERKLRIGSADSNRVVRIKETYVGAQ
jgi:VWFA-related protein